MDSTLARAAKAIREAETFFFAAGAGMGVDSGLPDFRGTQGFWRAYPVYANLKLEWRTLAQPHWFESDPTLAWGFYGHRLNLYRNAEPHAGYHILRSWAERKTEPSFVFTSNVDGHFARAGFDPAYIEEVHGNIALLQCTANCGIGIFPAEPVSVPIDAETLRAIEPLPSCPNCGALARPNILLFNDGGWDGSRQEAQNEQLVEWLKAIRGEKVVIIECGAGLGIPTVRVACEKIARALKATLIRINPNEPDVPAGQIAFATGALAALRELDAVVTG